MKLSIKCIVMMKTTSSHLDMNVNFHAAYTVLSYHCERPHRRKTLTVQTLYEKRQHCYSTHTTTKLVWAIRQVQLSKEQLPLNIIDL